MLLNMPICKPDSFTKDQVEMIGNTILFLAKQDLGLNKTKILHSLFLLEEACWKKYVRPFFDIPFQLWRQGPVVKDIYIDLSDEKPVLLSAWIKRAPDESSVFLPVADFNDDQFSEEDMDILQAVAAFITRKTDGELTRHNTNGHSLWYQNALQNGVTHFFKESMLHSTDMIIDFSILFPDNSPALDRYHAAKAIRSFIRQFKR